jgi:DHA1 family bicyclomycin/chloramphenicol resistance-like MFS transporter
MILAWGGMKLSLPALPELERVFEVPGDAMRATIADIFICFALGQLAWGMISDRMGRRGPLLAGLALASVRLGY